MATAVYIKKGENIDFKAEADVAYMEILPLIACVGVALEPIAAGETGAVTLTGVYEMPAASGVEIATGDAVFWNTENGNIDKDATGTPAGIAVADKASAGTTVRVKLGFVYAAPTETEGKTP